MANRKINLYLQSAYPVRLREVHLINAPSFLDKILSLFKPLMKDKLAERVFSKKNTVQQFLSYRKCLDPHSPRRCFSAKVLVQGRAPQGIWRRCWRAEGAQW